MKEENKMEQEKVEVKEDKKQEEKQKKAKMQKKIVKSINFPELVDVVLDPDGKVIYLVKEKGNLAIYRHWIIEEAVLIQKYSIL